MSFITSTSPEDNKYRNCLNCGKIIPACQTYCREDGIKLGINEIMIELNKAEEYKKIAKIEDEK